MGKAREIADSSYFELNTQRNNKKLNGMQRNVINIANPTFNQQGSNQLTSYFNKTGDVLTGTLSHTALIATISSDVLTVDLTGTFTLTDGSTSVAGYTSNRIFVKGEGGLADNLVTMSRPTHNQFSTLYLSSAGAGVITVKNTGNIITTNGVDLIMNDTNDCYVFVWNEITSKWCQIPESSSGGSGTSFIAFTADADLNMGSFNIKTNISPATNIFQIIFDAHDNSDTSISNSTTVDRININSGGNNVIGILPTSVNIFQVLNLNADLNLDSNTLFYNSTNKHTTTGNLNIVYSNNSEVYRYTNTLFKFSKDVDLDGNSFIVDADADSIISSITDDNIQIATGGSVRVSISNSFTTIENALLLNDSTTLGNSTADLITFNGRISGNPDPVNNTIALGQAGLRWSNLYTGKVDITSTSGVTGTAIKINSNGGIVDFDGNATSTTATSGGQTLPANPAGFINIKVGAISHRVPYYNT